MRGLRKTRERSLGHQAFKNIISTYMYVQYVPTSILNIRSKYIARNVALLIGFLNIIIFHALSGVGRYDIGNI